MEGEHNYIMEAVKSYEIKNNFPDVIVLFLEGERRGLLTREMWCGFLAAAIEAIDKYCSTNYNIVLNKAYADFPEVTNFFKDVAKEGMLTEKRLSAFYSNLHSVVIKLRGETKMCEKNSQKEERRRGDLYDAREMSESEAAYHEWEAENFDEEAWLKRHGLIHPEVSVAEDAR